RNGHDCGRNRRGRAGCIYFSRRRLRRFDADSCRRRARRAPCAAGGWRSRVDRTKISAGLIALLRSCGGGGSNAQRAVRGASKNFTEQVVLGEIAAQHLEHRLKMKVERRLNLGGTLLAHQALLNREIDLYPEYTGTALAAILKEPAISETGASLARV